MKKIYFAFLLFTIVGKAQIITFTDAALKTSLLDSYDDHGNPVLIDANFDGEIQVSEALATTQLWVTSRGISNLEGLQYFTNLTLLDCSSNQLTSLAGISALMGLDTLKCNENLFTTLDVSGLTGLEHLECYSNQIGSLTITNLTNLAYIDCQSNPMTSLNLSGLPALVSLRCVSNQLATLNLSEVPSLQELFCSNNALTSLNVSPLVNLKALICDENDLSSLNLAGLTQLEVLSCNNNPLQTLNVSVMPGLKQLSCTGIGLSVLDVSMLTNLERLFVNSNNLTEMNLDGLSHLTHFNASSNNISSLSLNGLSSLVYLNCVYNSLTSLDLPDAPDLDGVYFSHNAITSIDISGMQHLINVGGDYNQLTSIDLSGGLTALTYLNLEHNNLTTLDLSGLTSLGIIYAEHNNLQSINVKNGMDEHVLVADNPGLQSICADEMQLEIIQTTLNNAGMTNTVLGSYCSFEPGGIYDTISGVIRFDANGNGCDVADGIITNLRIDINDGTNSGATIINDSGDYSVFTQAPTIVITPNIENPSYFLISPATATINNPLNGTTQTQNFCIAPNGNHSDLEMVLIPILVARPGFEAHYRLIYKNKGNQPLSGTATLAFDDLVTDLVSAVPSASSQAFGLLSWNYVNLSPFESRAIDLVLHINAPTDTPAVNANDILNFTASINPITGDDSPFDNVFFLSQIVVNSFDPNDKICLEGHTVSPAQIGDYLHYTINFENTGTAPAEKIVVKDLIDTAKFDITSLQVTDASHAMRSKITGNKVEFMFENIQLAAGMYGNVTFKIKTKANLVVGNSVSNKADIFFDYNFPVVTDPAVTTFQILGVEDFKIDDSVLIVPNPATDFVTVKANNDIKSITLFDVQGRNLMTQLSAGLQAKLDIANYPKGVYFLKILTVKGSKAEKLIRK